jgi:MFS transporter, PAT family, beta-lactamase induction signal transducer AmpG
MLTRLLTSLYTAQGLPFGFFTLAVPVILREAGWSLTAINLLQLLGLPWVLKFMWAPWLDQALQQSHARRRWLLVLQGLSCAVAALAALVCAVWPALSTGAWPWLPLAGLFALVLAFNVLASTQDIVTDSLAVRALSARQRGWANGIQVGAYRLGMILGGGGLLWLFAHTGWPWMLLAMALLLAVLTVPVWLWRDATTSAQAMLTAPMAQPVRPQRTWLPAWWHRVHHPGMRTALALIVCYRFGDQVVSSLITPFVADQVADKATVALLKGTVGSVTSLVGALLGGWCLLRMPRRSALLWAGMAQSATFVLYLVAAWGLGGMPLLWAATVLEGLFGTLATVALFAWMMDAADPDHAGADYTLMASMVVLAGSVAGLAGGVLGDAFGYAVPFGLGTLLCVGGTWGVVHWQDKHPVHPRVRDAWH